MDINCPYCDAELDINHDDGEGYEQDCSHEMECKHCEKRFVFTTHISFSYEAKKADCLNDGKHDYQLTHTHPRELSEMRCSMCGHERGLKSDERIKYNIGSVKDYLNKLKFV